MFSLTAYSALASECFALEQFLLTEYFVHRRRQWQWNTAAPPPRRRCGVIGAGFPSKSVPPEPTRCSPSCRGGWRCGRRRGRWQQRRGCRDGAGRRLRAGRGKASSAQCPSGPRGGEGKAAAAVRQFLQVLTVFDLLHSDIVLPVFIISC